MIKRPFDRALYEAYDQKAKDTLEAYLVGKGHEILRTEENYGVDIVSSKDGHIFYNECEVKVAWTGDWPTTWAEIRIPERKTRLLKMYRPMGGFLNFYIFDKELDKAWRIKDTLLTEEGLKEASGRYIRKGERFFHIPYKTAELVEMT